MLADDVFTAQSGDRHDESILILGAWMVLSKLCTVWTFGSSRLQRSNCRQTQMRAVNGVADGHICCLTSATNFAVADIVVVRTVVRLYFCAGQLIPFRLADCQYKIEQYPPPSQSQCGRIRASHT